MTKHRKAENQDCYFILHIQEHLAPTWSEGYEGFTVSYTPSGETLISALIPDQSALHGLLARIRDLNLTLISVNPGVKGKLTTAKFEDAQSKMEE
jgi:hypothetical protein